MSFSIFRCYELQCAHRLTKVPRGHKCRREHGHNFSIEIHVSPVQDESARVQCVPFDGLDAQGMVCDYDDIDRAWRPVFNRLDHRSLNKFIDNPTSENLARYICEAVERNLARICKMRRRHQEVRVRHVVVRENARSGAVYLNDEF